MLRMIIVDESCKAVSTLEQLFQNNFAVSSLAPESLEEAIKKSTCGPSLVLYISTAEPVVAEKNIDQIRSAWPKTIVLLMLPKLLNEQQLGGMNIRAHTTLFKPCSKIRIVNLVENYCSLIDDSENVSQENALLSTLVEFVGEHHPSLYIAYNRLMPLIMNVCNAAKTDWRRVQKIFMLFIILLSKLDERMVNVIMHGEGRSAKGLQDLYVPLEKMSDMLSLTPSTSVFAPDLKYVLKRFDGEGVPKDDVKEDGLPIASRVIRMLMDYHYLLQSGKSVGQAIYVLNRRKGWYDLELFHALVHVLGEESKRGIREVYPLGLVTGMEIAEDVFGYIDGNKKKIISRNEILTDATIDYLQRHCEDILDITEPIMVVEELFTTAGEADV